MQRIRTAIRITFFSLLALLLKRRTGLKLFNWFYNQSGNTVRKILYRHTPRPNLSFEWKIKLLNGKTILSPVDVKDPYTWDLSLLYNNVSPQLCILELTLFKVLKENLVYMDIGANQGMRSFIPLSEGITTYLFEPNDYLTNIIEKRCRLNNWSNYKIENIALSNQEGSQEFFFSHEPSMSSLEKSFAEQRGISESKQIEISAIDQYIKKHRIKAKNWFFKIDVEGHEKEVILGAETTIQEHRPTMLIEIFSELYSKELFIYLSSLGYKVYGVNYKTNKILTLITQASQLDSYQASDYLYVYQQDLNASLAELL